MEEKITYLEERRRILYNKYTYQFMIAVFCAILGIIMLVFGLSSKLTVLWVIAIVVFCAGIVIGYLSRRKRGQMLDLLKSELISVIINKYYQDIEYLPNESIDLERIKNAEIVEAPDKFKGEDYIKGTYKGITFEVSDVLLSKDAKNEEGEVVSEEYFKGRWYLFTFDKKLGGNVLKISEDKPLKVKKLKRIKTENEDFNKKFTTYATTEEFAASLLIPRVLEKLLDLEKRHKGDIYYCFKENQLHVAVNDGVNYLEIPLAEEITLDSIKGIRNDITLIGYIIDMLGLSTAKFTDKKKNEENQDEEDASESIDDITNESNELDEAANDDFENEENHAQYGESYNEKLDDSNKEEEE